MILMLRCRALNSAWHVLGAGILGLVKQNLC